MCEKGFEFLDHTADVLVKAWGRTLPEALSEIARGMFEIMTDTSKIEPTTAVEIEVCGFDLENLVYRWLEELLYYHDSKNLVFGEFQVVSIEEKSSGDNEKSICLKAIVKGEVFNRDKHESRTVVKAVTYHNMSVMRENDKWIITVVFDI